MSKRIFLILLLSFVAFGGAASAQTTAFSYQGRLTEAGSAANGARFFRFTLFEENGAAIASVEQTLTVTNGVFNTSLDFGANAFAAGATRSLEIAVKANAGDAYTVLNPRQEILAAPYAIKSKTADDSNKLGGVDATRFVQQDASGNVTIAGGLTVSGSLSLNTVNAQTQYNLGGARILSVGNGSGNLFAGYGAGAANTFSSNNSFFGFNAGLSNTTGSQNTFVGANAGNPNQTGSENTFVGQAAGFSNTASSNAFFGAGAGASNTTGTNNAFFGPGAGRGNCSVFPCDVPMTGSNNSFFGAAAGKSNRTGGGNSFFGASAGANNTSGFDNAFFGINAGLSNAGGSYNSFFGNNAGYNNTSGTANNFVGGSAGGENTTGSGNSFFGDRAGNFGIGNGVTTGGGNTFVGNLSGKSIIGGNNNTMLGGNTSGTANINFATAVGANASVTQSNSIVLGAINGINGATVDTNVGIGTTAPQTRLQIKTASGNYGFTQTDGAITVGSYVGGSFSGATGGWLGTLSNNKLFFFANGGQPSMTVDTNGNVGVGTTAPNSKFTVAGLVESTTGGIKFPDGTIQTTAGGAGNAILNQTTQQAGANFNIAGTGTANIFNATTQFNLGGTRILSNAGSFNLFVGAGAGASNTPGSTTPDGNFNTFVGNGAGQTNTTGYRNSFFGNAAGFGNTSGIANSFFGYHAGLQNTTGRRNNFFGDEAGLSNTTGTANTFVGDSAGRANVSGGESSFFGYEAGLNNTAGQNSFFGSSAGRDNSTGSGNTFVGNAAGLLNTTGFQNTFVGTLSGLSLGNPTESNTTGSDNTFVGVAARPSVGNLTNATALGAGAIVSQSNSLVLGKNVNVGIGTSAPNSKLTVVGLIETTTGGVKFPDGTIQTTASTGGGAGVSSLNGLTGNVTLAAGSNITITPSGNTLTIASTGGASGGILNQTTLQTGASFNIDGNGAATTFTVNGIAVLRAKNNSISFGRNAGTLANSAADDNVFLGAFAGQKNAANNNVYVGFNAGRDNVSGGANVFVGDQAGAFGASGQRNVFVGQSAGFFNTGNNNSYFGTDAGSSTTGSNNVFVGTEAGTSSTNANSNAFVGYQSGWKNTTGSINSFFGFQAGRDNTTGFENAFFGSGAGDSNTVGDNNAFFGASAGNSNVEGRENTYIGYHAADNVQTGDRNTALGFQAGGSSNVGVASGNKNTFVGAEAQMNGTALFYATAIGAGARVSQNNSLVLGSVENPLVGTPSISVGIGTTAPKAKLDVTGGNILIGSPGQGIVLKSPDGATCKLLSIDNAGAMNLTAVACP